MTLEDLGYNSDLEKFRKDNRLDQLKVARVIAEHRERYIVNTTEREMEAEITGNMRFSAHGREDFPAVGDWVAVSVNDSNLAIIHRIFPRSSVIKRQSISNYGDDQLIASNIDFAFLVQAVGHDFNINRLERYLAICHTSGVSPVIVLSKIDLIDRDELSAITEKMKNRITDIPLVGVSNENGEGYETILSFIKKGKTYCLLGSSGAGKSTLLNNLSGKKIMKTGSISESTGKGKHVTSHRELIVLENGGILIDNPGMREVGIADTADGLERTFDLISELAETCRFRDCTHIKESGCAVIEAVDDGRLDKDSYHNYLKMVKEKTHYETTVSEKRRREKIFGKIIKNYNKDRDILS